jgi:hypothetical protein
MYLTKLKKSDGLQAFPALRPAPFCGCRDGVGSPMRPLRRQAAPTAAVSIDRWIKLPLRVAALVAGCR